MMPRKEFPTLMGDDISNFFWDDEEYDFDIFVRTRFNQSIYMSFLLAENYLVI
jgi:hypothetical protein